MLNGKRGWFGWSSKPKNPHSLEQLKYLYHVMSKNQNVSEQNKTLLVETLRSVAEILIWGDQNDSSVFDFFLEKNMLSFFLKIMKQKCGSYVCVQLLQTLNILFENIRNETSLYYLLSNNHVNSIIVHKFDFSDEEVMAYYISFLKTLSLKLNTHTIHFFFNEHTNDFPLYTEAIKFFNHSEKMVRIAVRTLTLNVFKVEEPAMIKFITDRTAVPYFSNLVWFIGNHVIEIDTCLKSSEKTQQTVVKLDDLVAEHLDHLHYLNDILLLQIDDLNAILSDHLLNRLLIPLYVYSLIEADEQEGSSRIRITRIISLFLLSQVFLIISQKALVRTLFDILFNGNMSIFEKPVFCAPPETLEESLIQVSKNNTPAASDEESAIDTSNPESSEESPTSANNEECDQERSANWRRGSGEPINDACITDEEKVAAAASSSNSGSLKRIYKSHEAENPFLDSLFDCLDCNQTKDDHSFMFSLCLVHAMVHNSGADGLDQECLSQIVCPSELSPGNGSNCDKLLGCLIQIMHLSCQYNSRIRLVTLEMSVNLLKKLVVKENGKSVLSDYHLASIEQAKEEAALILRNFFKSEEETIFLDLFEDEFLESQNRKLNVEYLMMDANLLLPPNQLTSLMMNGLDFTRRLPCADVERTRYAIRVFFLLRHLSLTLRGEDERQLPLTNHHSFVRVEQLLDLSKDRFFLSDHISLHPEINEHCITFLTNMFYSLDNSDLIACTVVMKDSTKTRRFMVIDLQQLILIEPDNRKLGFGVAKFVALLQDVEVNVDKEDSRSLHLTIRERNGSNQPKKVALSAKFVFDDHIRCMAAKQRLTKGRMKACQRKMHQIAKLIELGSFTTTSNNSIRSSSTSSLSSPREMSRSQSQEAFSRRHHINSHRPILPRLPGHAVAASTSESVTKKRSSSQVGSREGSPKPTVEPAVVPSEEMIPLEDMSPKTGRRRNRSRSENRLTDKLTVTQDESERI